VLALAGPDDLDAALLIRTADVDADGRFTIGAGATLVRGSDPAAEAMETRAKTSALLGALTGEGGENLSPGPVVRVPVPADDHLSAFWRRPAAAPPAPNGRRLMIVSAEDDFTGMLARMAESLGDDVRVVPWQHAAGTDADIVLIGPGPGDPRDRSDPRIDALHRLARDLLARRKPLLGVCLGHQVVAAQLGLEITRLSEPAQGVRRRITLDGRPRLVGLYHSFTAVSSADSMTSDLVDGPVQVTRDQAGGAVHALAARGLRSIQFHAESLLTEDGAAILDSMLAAVAKSTIDRLASKGLIRQGAQRHARC
jgi:phenazine biosynthesis protein phzE